MEAASRSLRLIGARYALYHPRISTPAVVESKYSKAPCVFRYTSTSSCLVANFVDALEYLFTSRFCNCGAGHGEQCKYYALSMFTDAGMPQHPTTDSPLALTRLRRVVFLSYGLPVALDPIGAGEPPKTGVEGALGLFPSRY